KKLYCFGEFRLDAGERVLWRGEEMLTLPPKVFDTLRLLVENEGRVVAKSELMDAVWADAFVEESNLSQNIYTLRRTLGVDEQGKQFIETVPRRGYRFAVPVKSIAADSTRPATQIEDVNCDNAPLTNNSPTAPSDPHSHQIKDALPLPIADAKAASPLKQSLRPRYVALLAIGVLVLAAGFALFILSFPPSVNQSCPAP